MGAREKIHSACGSAPGTINGLGTDAVQAIAHAYVKAGLSVIPVGLNGDKQPAFAVLPRTPDPEKPDRMKATWKPLQERLPIVQELQAWFGGSKPYAIAVVGGAVSGGVECLDLDDWDTAGEYLNELKSERPELFAKLCQEKTPNGLHLWYRADHIPGNTKLALRPDGHDVKGSPKVKTVIETRGEGGYAVVAGSPLAVHASGRPYYHLAGPNLTDLRWITAEEHDYLFRLAMTFDRDDASHTKPATPAKPTQGLSPAEDFDLRGPSFDQLLPDAAFTRPGQDTGAVRRPGKERGNSGTVGYCKGPRGEPLLKVFSTNWSPFECAKAYGKFQVLRLTHFNGDGAATMRQLRAEGYGAPMPIRTAAGPTTAPPAQARTGRVEPDIICLADVQPVKVPWLWPDRIPVGRISLLVGRPGAGKSFLTCDIAAKLSTGAAWPDGGVAPKGDILFISAEDDPADTIRPRLDDAGANCRHVHLLKSAKRIEEDGKELTLAFDLSQIDIVRESLNRHPNCRLVVVDPIGSYLGGRVDAHRDNEVRAILTPLAALAAEKGVAVLLVCHTRKGVAEFADDLTLGSRAFTAIARTVLHLSVDESDRNRKLLLPGKSNLGVPAPGLAFRIGEAPARLEWEPEPIDMHADDAISTGGAGGNSQDTRPRDTAKNWLAGLLKNGGLPVIEIEDQAKAAGMSMRTVRRAQGDLGIVPRKLGFSGKWIWELPGVETGQDGHVRDQDTMKVAKQKKRGHLRKTQGENEGKCLGKPQDGQIQVRLATFGEDLAILPPAQEVPPLTAPTQGLAQGSPGNGDREPRLCRPASEKKNRPTAQTGSLFDDVMPPD